MAESGCGLMSNSVNSQNQLSVVQRINQIENNDKTDKVMEPMLLEDSKHGEIPRTVLNLMDHFQSVRLAPDKNDIIVGFIHIMMTECGFVHKDSTDIVEDCGFNFQRVLKYSRTLPEGWKRDSTYHLDYVLKSMPKLVCKILCMSAADDLLVNCIIKDLDSFSLLIDPLTYFTTSATHIRNTAFQNLDHLSRSFKSAIAFPAKICIVRAGQGICPCLENLPPELQVKIMSYLNIDQVLNVAKTCKVLCQSANDAVLWMKLIDCDFRRKGIHKTSEELKFLFQIKYARELTKIMNKGPQC